ncbi:hypothetical protein R1flu_022332 [Riccia fluitans]|uniref:Diacylglycerol kinase n=1 Tax=Riccia fluitans TaxID=41844 RepID=A0ABD1ZUS7_9MARC
MTAEDSPHVLPETNTSYTGQGYGPLLSDDTQGVTSPLQLDSVLNPEAEAAAKQDVPSSDVKNSSSLHVLAERGSSFRDDDDRRGVLDDQQGSSESGAGTANFTNASDDQTRVPLREDERDDAPSLDKLGDKASSAPFDYSGRTDKTEATTTSDYTTKVESTVTGKNSFTQTTVDSEASFLPQKPLENESAAEDPSLLADLPPPARPHMLFRSVTEFKEDALKKLIVIPDYLGKGMASAIESGDTSYEEGPNQHTAKEAPAKPIIIFINAKSGGRLGPELEALLVELVASNQVYDLSKCKPVQVLRCGLGYLEEAAKAGDDCAQSTRNNLRIMVAGGDGTVGWVLSSVAEVEPREGFEVPPVGVIPLGTGNDLSRSFRWGGSFTRCTRGSVRRFLVKAADANIRNLDSWQVVVKPAPSRSDVPLKLPHCMREQHHVPRDDAEKQNYPAEVSPSFEGTFYNYFSVGMDAQVAYGFHHLRDEAPWIARGRLSNQLVYSGYGCVQGWFCTSCSSAPRARGIRHCVKIKVIKPEGSGEWEDVELPPGVRAVVILNLQSYAGGRNPWGHPSVNRLKQEGFVEARPDDGILEIVGLRDGWHTAVVMLELLTAYRLAQATAVKLEMGGNRERAYLQMDGEPWQQPLATADDDPAVVEIRKTPNPSIMLCRKKAEV